MSKIVYSHRIQGVLQQIVNELGLTLTLSDKGADIALQDNDKMFEDVAAILGLDLKRDVSNGVAIYTFRKTR